MKRTSDIWPRRRRAAPRKSTLRRRDISFHPISKAHKEFPDIFDRTSDVPVTPAGPIIKTDEPNAINMCGLVPVVMLHLSVPAVADHQRANGTESMHGPDSKHHRAMQCQPIMLISQYNTDDLINQQRYSVSPPICGGRRRYVDQRA